MPHPHSSLKIIALLDHKALSADEISKVLGTTRKTIWHQTARLVQWGQIEVVDERIQGVPTGNVRLDGNPIIAPIRTRVFRATDRGRARLGKKGGHKAICPSCTGGHGKGAAP